MTQMVRTNFALLAIILFAALAQPAMAVVNWIDTTGFWDVAANWSSNPLLPGATDDVVINVAGVQTITHRSGTHTINSLSMTGDDILAITGGALTVNNAYTDNANTDISAGTLTLNGLSSMASLTQSGGTLGGAGTLTVSGLATLTGGEQTGTGTSQFNGNVDITGNGLSTLSGGRVMNTAATTTWGGNTSNGGNRFDISGSATINNSGTWNDANAFDSSLGFGNPGTKVFNNSGTYNKTGNATTNIDTAFNNSGTVSVSAGQLNLNGNVDSTSTGTFNIAVGTTLSFGNGGSSGVATLDHVTFGGTGTLLIDASGNPGSDVLMLGTLSHAGTLAIARGTLQIDDSFSVPTYNQTGGEVTGAGTLTVSGLATLTGGEQTGTGTSQFNGNVDITGNGLSTLSGGRVMNTAATTTWGGNTSNGGNRFDISGSATINNSGTWNDANAFDSSLGFGNPGTKVFNNSGTYNKTGNATTDIDTAFNNSGTVSVSAGQLNLNGNVDSTSTGTFNIAVGTTLSFGNGGSSGVATLDHVTFGGTGTLLIDASGNPGSDVLMLGTLSHAGTLAIARGTLQIDDSFSVPTYNQTGGEVTGAGTLTVSGLATLTGGEQTGTGTSQFNGNVDITGNGLSTLSGGRVMNTAATTTWGGNTSNGGNRFDISGSATINNSGTWNDANAFDSSLGFGNPGTKVFNNSGTYNKTGNATTDIDTAFNNSGTVSVSAGQLNLNGNVDSTSTGTFNIAVGTTLSFGNGGSSGVATLDHVTFGGTGTLLIDASGNPGSDVLMLGTLSHAGTLAIARGTLQIDDSFSVPTYNQTGGEVTGAGTLTVSGLATLTGGEQTGTGTSQFNGNVDITGNGLSTLSGGRVMNTAATTTWGGNTSNGGNRFDISGSATINNSGTWNDANAFDSSLGFGNPGTKVFNNSGTYNKTGNATTNIDTAFNNSGTVSVSAGQLNLNGNVDSTSTGTFNIAVGTTLSFGNGGSSGVATLDHVTFGGTGTLLIDASGNPGSDVLMLGTLSHAGTLAIARGTLQIDDSFSVPTYNQTGGEVTGAGTLTVSGLATLTGGEQTGTGTSQFNGNVDITGNGLSTLSGGRVMNTAATTTWGGNTSNGGNRFDISGSATINNSGTWNDANAFDSSLGFGNPGTKVFNNSGTYNKTGNATTNIDTAFNNTGLVDVQAGTLVMTQGIQGTTGTLQLSGGIVDLLPDSTTGNLFHNTNAANSLILGVDNITVSIDYNNANFGVGNAFDRYANVSHTTGQILAAGDVAQALTGAGVTNGTTATPTLTIGNVHVGINTVDFQVANSGTTGPSLRGAIQTSVNGGNITDPNISVTPQNWGPVAPGSASGNIDVSFNAGSAGTLSLQPNQQIHITNNFDNVADQDLIITLGAGAAAYNLAQSSIVGPINLGVLHVGDNGGSVTQALSISNIAAAGAFTEGLDSSFGSYTNNGGSLTPTFSGSITNLAVADGASTAMTVSLSTLTAGTVNGNINIQQASNGTISGLANTALADQNPSVSGSVIATITNLAVAQINNAQPIDFGNVRVGTVLSPQTVSVTNAAPVSAFSEGLIGSATGTTGTGIIATGGFGSPGDSLAAGDTNPPNPAGSGSITVSIDTTSAGAKSGNAVLNFQSDGTAFSGGTVTDLGNTNVAVQGNVYRLATGNATPTPLDLGSFRLTAPTVTGNLDVQNTAANDGFSEQLGIQSVTPSNGLFTASSNLGATRINAQSTVNGAVTVGLGTGLAAGVNSGSVDIQYLSDGTVSGTGSPTNSNLQTVNVQATGYNVATGAASPTGPINLGNFHVGVSGGAVPQSVNIDVTNQAPATFSEQLGIASANVDNAAFALTNNLGTNLVDGGSTATGALNIARTGGAAGLNTGTIAVQYTSDGTNTSGLTAIDSNSQNITVNATGYNLAQSSIVGPINLGVLHVGDNGGSVTQALSISNIAAAGAFTEGLDSSFGSYTNNGGSLTPTFSGSITNLAVADGASTAMTVSLSTLTAGTVNGNINIQQASNGTISGLANTALADQNPSVSGSVIATITNLAVAQINNAQPIDFGNVRVGTVLSPQTVSVTNAAPVSAFSEGLIGSATGTTGTGIIATGGFGSPGDSLAAGDTNPPNPAGSGSITVSIDTTSAGAKSGNAVLNFQSDGTAFSGGTVTDLGNTNVAVQGNVYRLANPTLNTPSVTIAARVGDLVSANQAVSITNTSPDIYTEGLKVAVSSASGNAQGNGGAIANLASQGTDASSIQVGLASTATSGTTAGQVTLGLTSTGAGTTGATDISVGSAIVNVVGKVYQQAVAVVNTAAIDFGIVHVGDSVTAQSVSVTNNAPSAGLNDVLTGSIGAGGPFTAAGNLGAGLVASATDATSLLVGLNTSNAGIFSGNASLSTQSHNVDMSDLALADQLISLDATVNNYAVADIQQSSGDGSLSRSGDTITLDFGNLVQGSGPVDALLAALNNVTGQADLLDGSFSGVSGATDFSLIGFAAFTDLIAGASQGGLDVGFDPMALGLFSDTIALAAFGHNASGYIGDTQDLTLILKANVVAASVPEPGSLALVGIALFALVTIRRRPVRHQRV